MTGEIEEESKDVQRYQPMMEARASPEKSPTKKVRMIPAQEGSTQ